MITSYELKMFLPELRKNVTLYLDFPIFFPEITSSWHYIYYSNSEEILFPQWGKDSAVF